MLATSVDPMEIIFQAMRAKRPLEGSLVALERVESRQVWVVRLADPALEGIRAICPDGWSGVDEKDMANYVGTKQTFLTKELDREAGVAVLSRSDYIEQAREALKTAAKVGDVLPAAVKAVIPRREDSPARLVVEVAGVSVEIPRKLASRALSLPLDRQYRPGQVIAVKVLDPEKLELSVRDAYPDPWQVYSFTRGQVISGTVVRVVQGIVFVEPDVAPGIAGIAPYPVRGEVKRGNRVQCIVAMFDREKQKLHLRLRRVL